MVTLRSYLSLLILLSAMISQTMAGPMASIDRSVIAIDDTLIFTIRVNSTGSFKGPDLNSIYIDFDVLGNRQSSSHTIRNGVSESSTEWIITLAPKRKGRLTIPGINIDGEKTEPISVIVQASPPVSADLLKPVYLESEVDQNNVYVQQQIIFTLRIFQSIQLDNMNISEPEFDDALMEKLGQTSYQRKIQNTPYRVHELNYAIFPQKTGTLTIPELQFTANEAVARRSVFSLPGQGRAIRKMSKQHDIEVLPAPANFAGNSWLPAKSVLLTDKWSSDLDTIRVGDSITRTINVTANGLLDSQLPPFSFQSIPGAKLYPDQGSTDLSVTAEGVNSSRSDSVAIIPTKAGSLILPELRINWWDTVKKTNRTALLPATELTIKPALENAQGASTPLAVDHSQSGDPATLSPSSTPDANNRLWQIIAALLALAWAVTLLLWWRSSKATSSSSAPALASTPKRHDILSEHKAFSALSSVCTANDSTGSRAACIAWARLYWPGQSVNNLQDIAHCASNSELANDLESELQQLEKTLYGNDSEGNNWSGAQLIAVIQQLRKDRPKTVSSEQQHLPPLYKN